jgi:hypothetical protein
MVVAFVHTKIGISRTDTLLWEAGDTFWGKANHSRCGGKVSSCRGSERFARRILFHVGGFQGGADIQIITFSGFSVAKGESWPAIAKFFLPCSAIFPDVLLCWKTFSAAGSWGDGNISFANAARLSGFLHLLLIMSSLLCLSKQICRWPL